MLALLFTTLSLLLTGSDWANAQRLRSESHRSLDGLGADCAAYSRDYYARLRDAGIPARLAVVRVSKATFYDSHTFVEVLRDGRWVIQDPTFDGGWTLNGRQIGTAEMQGALSRGISHKIRWVGPTKLIRAYDSDPRLLFRHAYYRALDAAGEWVVARPDTSVSNLHAFYYAQQQRPAGATAGVIVMTGGSDWRIGQFTFIQLADARWASPIIVLPNDTSTIKPDGVGPGEMQILWVRRYR